MKNYLDDSFVGNVLDLLRLDAGWRPDVDVGVAGQFRKTGYASFANVSSGRFVIHHHAYVRRGGDLSLGVLVVPTYLRRRIPVDVALQDFRGAVLRLHGDRRVSELRPVCEIQF